MALTVTQNLGGTATKSATAGKTTTTNKSADLSYTRAVASDILGFKSKNLEYTADAQSQRTSAAGYDAEISSYQSSARVSRLNDLYSQLSSDITDYQDRRNTLKTVGTQKASLAGAGFSDSADIVRSTLQQGYLTRQIDRTQSLFEQAGYLEQASASDAQVTAAQTAKSSALSLASTYDDAAASSLTYATNATTALSGYLSKFKTTTTTEGLLSGEDIGADIATAPKVTETSSTDSSATSEPVHEKVAHSAFNEHGASFWTTDNPAYGSGLTSSQLSTVKKPETVGTAGA